MKKELVPTKINVENNATLAYVVRCHSVGNPDHGELPNLLVSIPEDIPCETLRQCSMACRNYIQKWQLGGGNWPEGQIFHPTKGLIACVSFNGKVWKPSRQITIQDLSGKQKRVEAPPEEIIKGLDDKLE